MQLSIILLLYGYLFRRLPFHSPSLGEHFAPPLVRYRFEGCRNDVLQIATGYLARHVTLQRSDQIDRSDGASRVLSEVDGGGVLIVMHGWL